MQDGPASSGNPRFHTTDAMADAIASTGFDLVAMHWGTENQTEPDEDQLKYAQLLADLGMDVTLGSHPHVIGPLAWINGKDGHNDDELQTVASPTPSAKRLLFF